ncbi:MAG: sigma-54-dependent Fis family transcriptional regulator [Candidatus Brocadia sp. AMX2]|uniref:Response regulator containing CheY-like receiver, AAA-type ATPase and DNA-binding domains n=1 Tax=Candidatus Brocadia sinica JPN1 TaxID=1197129 RepID=A0ABQ0JX41_9BACT|nr:MULTISPECIES: sigma-54 dependent transcriptional regulator [Brocadia]KXK30345.1 MAG: two-component response regulator [Candidatus Brocadia sinica]MBC6931075.1 sigma-54-dependent Fis family transcriptional regulator [Candidatus Brocadia sp.]MBL1168148.1 sigma-54-dependent Fis family transcriptional regulator [Candidatus Brocadia sp. AMX1]NOG40920.1 sigma-54-dependent Fis family transcriptional regulator [Planctomycetota bacterium]KAA0241645.1 MAG: sigma-54-dependent Fis family transcriptiona
MKKPKILLAERNDVLNKKLKMLLFGNGFEVIETSDKGDALRSFQNNSPDLVIVGSSPGDTRDGLGVAQQIRQSGCNIPLIMIAAHSSEDQAIAALKAGINDYFKQPFSFEELMASVKRCLSGFFLRESSREHGVTPPCLIDSQKMIGENVQIREIKTYIGKAASTDTNVLITGETGTGKELAAELIHRNSPRSKKPFVCINCTAIPDSLLESELFGYERGAFTGADSLKEGKLKHAEGGTVFFDEIGDMSLYHQAKILRAIESKEVQRIGGKGSIPLDIRFVAATNRDLDQLVEEGKFRKDLYFRLNVARIHLPPLRNRKEDIPLLLCFYIRELNLRFGREVECLTKDALEYLLCYDWPGNVRELKNLVEATFVNLSSRQISLSDLPEQFRRRIGEARDLPRSEPDLLLSTLMSTNWNKSKAAQKLHWSRMTLYRKLAKYHIVKEGT